MKNGALVSLSFLQGIYFTSDNVNGKPSWIKGNSYAIWYNADINFWLIAPLGYLGGRLATIKAKNEFEGLSDKRNEWSYWNGSSWINANRNDIDVQCKGKIINMV